MKSKAQPDNSPADLAKLALSALIGLAGLTGFYYFATEPQLYRVLGLLAAFAIAIAIAMTSRQGQALWGFMQDARTETRKVVWPTRQETVRTTLLVFVVVTLVAVFLWLLDILLGWGVESLILSGV